MMKKIVGIVFTFGMLTAFAADFGWEWDVKSDGTAVLTEVRGWPKGRIEVPSHIDGHVVTELGSGLFNECDDIVEIVVPDTVTEIGMGAFSWCSVEKITLPHGLRSLGDETWLYLDWGEDGYVFSPETANAWVSYFNVNRLKSVVFSNGSLSNDDGTIWIDGRMILHSCALSGDWRVTTLLGIMGSGLKGKVVVPDGVNGIAAQVFEDLDDVTEISFPESLVALSQGGYVFGWMHGLERLTVRGTGSPYKVLGGSLVDTRTGLLVCAATGAQIPVDGSVRRISSRAFSNGLFDEVVIPDAVTTIERDAFVECPAKKISVSAGTTHILGGAFSCLPMLDFLSVSPDNPKYEVVNGCLVEKAGLRTLVSPGIPQKQEKRTLKYKGKTYAYYDYDCYVPYFCRGLAASAFHDDARIMKLNVPKDLQYVTDDDYWTDVFASWSDIEEIEISDCATASEMTASKTYALLDPMTYDAYMYDFHGFTWTDFPQVAVRTVPGVSAAGFGRFKAGSRVTLTATCEEKGMTAAWLDENGVTNAVGSKFVLTMPSEDILFTVIPVKGSSGGGGLDVPAGWQKARNLTGVLGIEGTPTGLIQVSVGKPNKKSGEVSVKGSITGLDGKKLTLKATGKSVLSGDEIEAVLTAKGKEGDVTVRVNSEGLVSCTCALDGSSLMTGVEIGEGLAEGSHAFSMDGNWATNVVGGLVALMPTNEIFTVSDRGVWTFDKAAKVAWKKDKGSGEYALEVKTDKGCVNLSGLKLKFAKKTGLVSGGFTVYALVDNKGKTKLVKYKAKVSGLVIGGQGYCIVTIKDVPPLDAAIF